MFRVILVCGSRQSHRLGGKPSATPAKTLRKWTLKFWIATYAALCRWHPGGTSSSLQLSQMWFFMVSDTSLSMTCFFGVMPALLSHSKRALYARIILASLRLFIGLTKMALLSISTIIMMYLLPRLDLVGSCLVWSENVFCGPRTLICRRLEFFASHFWILGNLEWYSLHFC